MVLDVSLAGLDLVCLCFFQGSLNAVVIGQFRHIKTQLDGEAQRTQTKEMNKHGHSIAFVCVLWSSLPS